MNQDNVLPLKILLVEDEPLVMMITCKILEDLGYQPDCATNGAQAIKLANINHYHVIFMDIGLPDIDGIAVTQEIRQYERENNQRSSHVFAITAYSLAEVKDKCFAVGMNDVFNKPVAPETFKKLLAEISP